MPTPLRDIDMDDARARHAAFEAKCKALALTGQRLCARIRPSSNYFGQSGEGKLFPVAVASDDEYCVVGGPGGKYRLRDVDLFAIFTDDAKPIQITFEHQP